MLNSWSVILMMIVTLLLFAVPGIYMLRGEVQSFEDYVSAPGSTGRWKTAATLVASGMGAWILFSPAEAGAAYGGISAIVGYVVGSMVAMGAFMVLGPRIRRLIPQGHTLTEYVLVRYGMYMYVYVIIVSIGYMFLFLAAEFTGITKVLHLLAGVPRWQTASLIGLVVLSYSAYGGLKASILTDAIQTTFLLPLLMISLIAALYQFGGLFRVYLRITDTQPQLLDPTFWPGIQAGIYIVIAVVGAEMMNQAWWQRVYSARDSRVLMQSFAMAALVMGPVIFLFGLFGPIAVSYGWVNTDLATAGYNADVAFFRVLIESFPGWLSGGIVMAAVLLVMSTADTLFNAISSLISGDLRHFVSMKPGYLSFVARCVTFLVAFGAIVIGAVGFSVFQLFLLADLLAVATFVPVLAGLFSRRPHEGGVMVVSITSLIGGALYFPLLVKKIPLIEPFLLSASHFHAFSMALGISLLGTVCMQLLPATFSYDRFSHEIKRLGD